MYYILLHVHILHYILTYIHIHICERERDVPGSGATGDDWWNGLGVAPGCSGTTLFVLVLCPAKMEERAESKSEQRKKEKRLEWRGIPAC